MNPQVKDECGNIMELRDDGVITLLLKGQKKERIIGRMCGDIYFRGITNKNQLLFSVEGIGFNRDALKWLRPKKIVIDDVSDKADPHRHILLWEDYELHKQDFQFDLQNYEPQTYVREKYFDVLPLSHLDGLPEDNLRNKTRKEHISLMKDLIECLSVFAEAGKYLTGGRAADEAIIFWNGQSSEGTLSVTPTSLCVGHFLSALSAVIDAKKCESEKETLDFLLRRNIYLLDIIKPFATFELNSQYLLSYGNPPVGLMDFRSNPITTELKRQDFIWAESLYKQQNSPH